MVIFVHVTLAVHAVLLVVGVLLPLLSLVARSLSVLRFLSVELFLGAVVYTMAGAVIGAHIGPYTSDARNRPFSALFDIFLALGVMFALGIYVATIRRDTLYGARAGRKNRGTSEESRRRHEARQRFNADLAYLTSRPSVDVMTEDEYDGWIRRAKDLISAGYRTRSAPCATIRRLWGEQRRWIQVIAIVEIGLSIVMSVIVTISYSPILLIMPIIAVGAFVTPAAVEASNRRFADKQYAEDLVRAGKRVLALLNEYQARSTRQRRFSWFTPRVPRTQNRYVRIALASRQER